MKSIRGVSMIVQKKYSTINKPQAKNCFNIPIGTNKSPFGNQQVVASPLVSLIYSHARRTKPFNVSDVLFITLTENGGKSD